MKMFTERSSYWLKLKLNILVFLSTLKIFCIWDNKLFYWTGLIQLFHFLFFHKFSPFVKVGAESYVLGHAVKKSPRIAEAEKIRIVVSSDV